MTIWKDGENQSQRKPIASSSSSVLVKPAKLAKNSPNLNGRCTRLSSNSCSIAWLQIQACIFPCPCLICHRQGLFFLSLLVALLALPLPAALLLTLGVRMGTQAILAAMRPLLRTGLTAGSDWSCLELTTCFPWMTVAISAGRGTSFL